MINIGQLVGEYANDNKNKVWLVGFGTYKGTVIAAREWGEKMERMQVPPAVEGSWDNIIHQQINDNNNRLFIFKNDVTPIDRLTKYTKNENSKTRTRTEKGPGQRAIGVVYNPEYERYGNYVPSIIDKRYDMYLHIDKKNSKSTTYAGG
jgi:erythromycin esterase